MMARHNLGYFQSKVSLKIIYIFITLLDLFVGSFLNDLHLEELKGYNYTYLIYCSVNYQQHVFVYLQMAWNDTEF
jgi:hypothetical protein